MLFIKHNVSLKKHSTMRLGGKATHFVIAKNRKTLIAAIDWAKKHHLNFIVIGDGSNIIWRDVGFSGLIIANRIKKYSLKANSNEATLTVGAGENWDNIVGRTVKVGWSGIEALSLIPGTAGATPVQNVGAYGSEIKDVLLSLEAYDSQKQKIVTIQPSECGFGYRTSKFKTSERGRYAIISIALKLTKQLPQPPFYRAVENYFEQHNITRYSPQVVRSAVIAIRSSKLPDPAKVANNGSFFANPIITKNHTDGLLVKYPDMPYWPNPDGSVKLAAAWLIEQAGFKNYQDDETGMSTWPTQPLVLVNQKAKLTKDLLKFKQKIVSSVEDKFGITLEQEPELLP